MSSLSSSTTGAATPSAPSSPSVPPPPPLSSSSPSQPSTSAAPPPSSAPAPPSSTSSSQSSSSSITSAPSSPTSASVTQSQVIHKSTDSTGGVVTQTQTTQVTLSAAPSGSAASGVRTTSKGFLQNKGAVAAVFTIVGLVAAGILFVLVTAAVRRRRARRFDREIAEEAKRAPAPVFVDDDDDYNSGGYHSDPYSAGPTAYHDGGYGGGAVAHDPYAAPTVHSAPSEYPASDAVHSSAAGGGGTPSNYMYPSGYSDLGFSDVSSHGTYSQPPMDAYGASAGGAGYGAYGGAAAGVAGMGAGAYEMMGYPAHGHGQQGQQQTMAQQEWQHQQNQGMVGQVGYVYPGEEQQHQGYPPAPPPGPVPTNSSGSDVLGRSKSAGGGRSMEAPQYADGYVSQYQTHSNNGGHGGEDAYGGLEHSQHGHIGGLEDEESDGEGDGRRVLKVANE